MSETQERFREDESRVELLEPSERGGMALAVYVIFAVVAAHVFLAGFFVGMAIQ